MSNKKLVYRSDYQKLADKITTKIGEYRNLRNAEKLKTGENDAEFWQEEIDSLEEIRDQIGNLETDHDNQIETLESDVSDLEYDHENLPKLETMQDQIKAAISKRLCNNASIEQLEYFELQLAKKKGLDYTTGNDPIKPELQAVILARH